MSEDFQPHKIKLPEKGDILFKAAEDWWNNACVNYMHDDLDIYTRGFKRSADIIVQHAIDSQAGLDLIVYPAVYLYRHYIELRLKGIVRDGANFLGLDISTKKNHDLKELWECAKKIMLEVYEDEDGSNLEFLEGVIKQFYVIDNRSTVFRYPDGKAQSPSFFEIRHINLRNLQEVMAGVETILEAASMGITVYLEQKASTEAEYRKCYGDFYD